MSEPSAAVVDQIVSVATVETDRGTSSATVVEQLPTATLAAEQGPPGRPGMDGRPGEPGESVITDPGDLTLIFENYLL